MVNHYDSHLLVIWTTALDITHDLFMTVHNSRMAMVATRLAIMVEHLSVPTDIYNTELHGFRICIHTYTNMKKVRRKYES